MNHPKPYHKSAKSHHHLDLSALAEYPNDYNDNDKSLIKAFLLAQSYHKNLD
jgi:hypothetical protein